MCRRGANGSAANAAPPPPLPIGSPGELWPDSDRDVTREPLPEPALLATAAAPPPPDVEVIDKVVDGSEAAGKKPPAPPPGSGDVGASVAAGGSVHTDCRVTRL